MTFTILYCSVLYYAWFYVCDDNDMFLSYTTLLNLLYYIKLNKAMLLYYTIVYGTAAHHTIQTIQAC